MVHSSTESEPPMSERKIIPLILQKQYAWMAAGILCRHVLFIGFRKAKPGGLSFEDKKPA